MPDQMKKYWFLPPHGSPKLIYYIRNFCGLNQVEMSQLLGNTQGWLSKMEQGIGEVRFNLEQWKALKVNLDISIDHLVLGQVPYKKLLKNYKYASFLPHQYSQNSNTVIKTTYPILMLLVDALGEVETFSILKKLKLEDYHFVEPSLPINSDMLLDLFNIAINLGILTDQPATLSRLVKHAVDPKVFGEQFIRLDTAKNDIRTNFTKFLNIIYIQNGLESALDLSTAENVLRLNLPRPSHTRKGIAENLTNIFAKYTSSLFAEINKSTIINYQIPFNEILIYEFS